MYRDPDTVKHHRLFFIASAIAVASLLTALTTLVLAVAIMTKRNEVSTGAPSCQICYFLFIQIINVIEKVN